MGKTNRTAALESKIAHLLGEREDVCKAIEFAEKLIAELPGRKERLCEIDDLINACETVIRSDRPDWTREHILVKKRFKHTIPVRLGASVKLALDVLREAGEPMTVREIAKEVLRREGQLSPSADTVKKVADNIGNQFRKHDRPYLANDGQWPARWWVIRPE